MGLEKRRTLRFEEKVCFAAIQNVDIRLTKLSGKLVFVGLTPDYLSLRTRPLPGVAIPRLKGKCIDNCPTGRGNLAIFGGNRYLVPFNRGIATPLKRTGSQ